MDIVLRNARLPGEPGRTVDIGIAKGKIAAIESALSADAGVTRADYFDAAAVPDDAIVNIRSVLTVVDGKIVHGRAADLR